jgi:hypothetical protein
MSVRNKNVAVRRHGDVRRTVESILGLSRYARLSQSQ